MPAARVGTEMLLDRLRPYETGNRMAAVLVAATVPPLGSRAAQDAPAPLPDGLPLQRLVDTIGYLMQPSRNADLRSSAIQVLEQRFAEVQPYLRPERLAQLDLPTAPPPDPGDEPHGLGSLIRRVARRRWPSVASQLAISRAPASPDFSGWNWVEASGPPPPRRRTGPRRARPR